MPRGITLARVKSPKDTLSDILPLSGRIGITRISDITYLDKLFVPNYSVTLPGTADSIWVYSGKGVTKSSAKASAIMEAVERITSLSRHSHLSFIRGTYSDLAKSYEKVLHPNEVVEPTAPIFDESTTLQDYLPGFDLLTKETVLVPAELALYRFSPRPPASSVFQSFHTNGLASGNVLEEAVFHSLCEVIERDAISIADLSCSSIPYNIVRTLGERINNSKITKKSINLPPEDKFVDDFGIYQDVNISELMNELGVVKTLVERFAENNISLLIKDITQKDIGIPTFAASSIEWLTHNYGLFARGYGTHIDPTIALVRAVLEVSQTRVANVQGARDDLRKIHYRENDEIYKRKWSFIPNFFSSTDSNRPKESNFIHVSEFQNHSTNDILCDINLILNNFRKAGVKRAIIVELTSPDFDIPVVRAIVPGLESFEVTSCIMGTRAKKFFKNICLPYFK
jgi:ribosomal protein S12 methylthiotransferase accessory factor YcaO